MMKIKGLIVLPLLISGCGSAGLHNPDENHGNRVSLSDTSFSCYFEKTGYEIFSFNIVNPEEGYKKLEKIARSRGGTVGDCNLIIY